MGWRRSVVVLVALAALVPVPASAAPPQTRGTSVTVLTEPGATATVAARLRRQGYRVDRRVGRRLQVVVRRSVERRALTQVVGVADVMSPPTAYGDVVVSQGVDRTGASALKDVAADGAGLRIAILDLGFGLGVASLQAAGELPPAARVEVRSFDPAAGIVGTNAYGGFTDHGELVAQTIYDYVPRANYLFVNYHTPDDFVAAVDWLATQNVDVVVHSNNFLDGPFDGTSAVARAVDRAAAAGILWFNSAGNYGEKHWSGPWADADGDGVLDWPGNQPWTVTHQANHALTFHLSWTQPPGGLTSDIDLTLERHEADGTWTAVAVSDDKQRLGAPPSERIAGVRPSVAGEFRLRAVLVNGAPPAGQLQLYAREDDIVALSGSRLGSTPTPADAAGSISVGAVDWRSNTLTRYSSRGPTVDGRRKPELVAPTGTSLVDADDGDPIEVGGTSIAAPNAAGAAAVALGALRRSGLRPTVAEVRAMLARDAFDLGEPGPDLTFGAGRIRVDVQPPELRTVIDLPRRPLRGRAHVAVEPTDAGPVATWVLSVDDVRRREGRVARDIVDVTFDTRPYADGAHTAALDISDAVGNVRRRTWRLVVDNTAPLLTIDALRVGALADTSPGRPKQVPLRPIGITVSTSDALGGDVAVSVTLRKLPAGPTTIRSVSLATGTSRSFGLGSRPPGIYRVTVVAGDRAGNATTRSSEVRVPGRR
jgi:Subtilase family